MGWDHRRSGTQADVIAERIAPWKMSDGGTMRTVAHRRTPGVLWTVRERLDKCGNTIGDKWIGCDLIEGLGYKALAECMHPYYYDCPLQFLDITPVACEAWRVLVREYHNKHGRLSTR